MSAGSKAVYVMIDPTNEIVEGSERDNIVYLPEDCPPTPPRSMWWLRSSA